MMFADRKENAMQPIVVTGATGTVGSQIVAQLLSAEMPVRAAVRNPDKVAPGPGLEAAAIDFSRPATLEAALEGCGHLFLLTALTPEMVAQSNALVDAAEAVGVVHVIKLSALGAGYDARIELGRWHTESERYLEESGLGWTHLRPNSFMQNYVTFHGETIRGQNAFYLPHGDGKMSLIDVRDVAAVAVATLTRPGHMGKAYELTGPEAIDNREVAAILGDVLGREITYVDVPDETARQAMSDMGSPEVMIDVLMELNNVIRAGRTEVVTDSVERVTGKPARTFAQFARDYANSWRA
jgi:uncharacterized protein YbjT (DUF2867 family)